MMSTMHFVHNCLTLSITLLSFPFFLPLPSQLTSFFSFFLLFFFSSHDFLTFSHFTTPHHTITIRCICVHHHVDCFGYVTHVCLFVFMRLFYFYYYYYVLYIYIFVYFVVKTPRYAEMHQV